MNRSKFVDLIPSIRKALAYRASRLGMRGERRESFISDGLSESYILYTRLADPSLAHASPLARYASSRVLSHPRPTVSIDTLDTLPTRSLADRLPTDLVDWRESLSSRDRLLVDVLISYNGSATDAAECLGVSVSRISSRRKQLWESWLSQ